MSRPWTDNDVLLLGHSQMEGLAPFLTQHLHEAGAITVHVHTQRGINLRRLQRQRHTGLRIVAPGLADELPLALVALSGNGAITDRAELRANMQWLRAEYPHALIAWLGHTITRTGTEADEQRAAAAALEERTVPEDPRFLWVDMRLPSAQLAGDGVHLTRDGYRVLAAHAWTQVLDGTRERENEEERASVWPALIGGALVGAITALGYRAWARQQDEVET